MLVKINYMLDSIGFGVAAYVASCGNLREGMIVAAATYSLTSLILFFAEFTYEEE